MSAFEGFFFMKETKVFMKQQKKVRLKIRSKTQKRGTRDRNWFFFMLVAEGRDEGSTRKDG